MTNLQLPTPKGLLIGNWKLGVETLFGSLAWLQL